jgi:hypothetical protein
MMNKILIWLSGKKSIISGLITTTSAYLALTGVITNDLAVYINAISLLIFGTASIATTQMYNK